MKECSGAGSSTPLDGASFHARRTKCLAEAESRSRSCLGKLEDVYSGGNEDTEAKVTAES